MNKFVKIASEATYNVICADMDKDNDYADRISFTCPRENSGYFAILSILKNGQTASRKFIMDLIGYPSSYYSTNFDILLKANLIKRVKRGFYKITNFGQKYLSRYYRFHDSKIKVI